MKLINAKDYTLREFHGDGVPSYTILSHTWADDEVSFRDMADLTVARRRRGFRKIQLCCRQTERDGYQWAWVDTCCIDRDSSAELSEAINSMFRYYARAMVCYAHLSDVDLARGDRTAAAMRQFEKSRWFTRGWTLQELIAPVCVSFYDVDWTFLGTKNELKETIAEITGISRLVLTLHRPLHMVPALTIMKWASERATTRVEDAAYCLMGIFGVNMPLLYGEGDKAFFRLQREILLEREDHSLFLWDSQRSTSRRVVDDQNSESDSAQDSDEGIDEYEPIQWVRREIFARSPSWFRNAPSIMLRHTGQTTSSMQVTASRMSMRAFVTPVTRDTFPELMERIAAADNGERLREFYFASLECIITSKGFLWRPPGTAKRTRYGQDYCIAILLSKPAARASSLQRGMTWCRGFYAVVEVGRLYKTWSVQTIDIESGEGGLAAPGELNGTRLHPHRDEAAAPPMRPIRWEGPKEGWELLDEEHDLSRTAFTLANEDAGAAVSVLCHLEITSGVLRGAENLGLVETSMSRLPPSGGHGLTEWLAKRMPDPSLGGWIDSHEAFVQRSMRLRHFGEGDTRLVVTLRSGRADDDEPVDAVVYLSWRRAAKGPLAVFAKQKEKRAQGPPPNEARPKPTPNGEAYESPPRHRPTPSGDYYETSPRQRVPPSEAYGSSPRHKSRASDEVYGSSPRHKSMTSDDVFGSSPTPRQKSTPSGDFFEGPPRHKPTNSGDIYGSSPTARHKPIPRHFDREAPVPRHVDRER